MVRFFTLTTMFLLAFVSSFGQEIPGKYERHFVLDSGITANTIRQKKPISGIWSYSKANFYQSIFSNPVDFSACKFEVDADFRHTRFSNGLNFSFVYLSSKTLFNHAEFNGDAIFLRSKFKSITSFNEAVFGGVTFIQTQFFGRTSFENCKFKKVSNFIGAEFNRSVSFRGAVFDTTADFSAAKFQGSLDFTNVEVNDDLILRNITLPDTMFLINVRIHGYLDLRDAKVRSKKCVLALSNVDVKQIRMDYSKFRLNPVQDILNKRINITATTNNILLYSTRILDSADIVSSTDGVFADILLNQKNGSYEEGYKNADIDFKKWKLWKLRDSDFAYWQYWWILRFREWWDNFGYNREFIFRNTAILFILSFVFIWGSFRTLINHIYCPKGLHVLKEKTWIIDRQNGDAIRIMPYAFFYTFILFFGFKFEWDFLKIRGDFISNWQRRILMAVVFAIYLLGIICTAYLAGYVLRD